MILDRPLRHEIAREITGALHGAIVRRVHLPHPDTLVLILRGTAGEQRLLASAGARNARVHLTTRRDQNPAFPPPFCMLARKHLEGRAFEEAVAEHDVPVVHLRFGARRGAKTDRAVLAVELTGHASTVILCAENGDETRILGVLRPLPAARRDLTTGAAYRLPRLDGRLDPERASADEVISGIERLGASDGRRAVRDPGRLLSRLFEGVGRHLAAEAIAQSGLPAESLAGGVDEAGAEALLTAFRALLARPCNPRLLPGAADGAPAVLLPFPLPATGQEGSPVKSLSGALDDLAGSEGAAQALETHRGRTLRALTRLIDHRELKLDRQRSDLAEAKRGERWRRQADLLLTQPDARRRGLEAIEVVDAFDAGGATLRIELDPARSLAANAERLYLRARKAKRAVSIIEGLIARGEIEMRFLREQALQAAQAGEVETLEAISESISAKARTGRPEKQIRPGRNPAKGRIPPDPKPRRFMLEGWEMLVGRHGRDNDRLVTRIGKPSDIWLHARSVPGAHVLLRCARSTEPPERILAAAARAAAYFSGARDERQADVTVTRLSHVRKLHGAPPGQVVAREGRTLRVPATLPEELEEFSGDAEDPVA
ncbi:MAG: NFACT RNA binding domain-containing protein [Deltaproteobacteria bacterium]|nr:NFACT RNA binding domain-containing protein [Deltaproteobacteria bacterium]